MRELLTIRQNVVTAALDAYLVWEYVGWDIDHQRWGNGFVCPTSTPLVVHQDYWTVVMLGYVLYK